MHAYIHTYILTYITLHYITLHYITLHTYIHAYIQAKIDLPIYIYIYTHTHVHTHTYVYIRTRAGWLSGRQVDGWGVGCWVARWLDG